MAVCGRSRKASRVKAWGRYREVKAKRLTHVKPGYYTPPGRPISVPGLHGVGLLLVGVSLRQGPALLAVMRCWTSRGWRASWARDEDKKLLEMAITSWGRKVLHVFDRGYARSLWLGALYHFSARFVLRWRHNYRLLFEGKLKAAWKIAASAKKPGAVAGCGMPVGASGSVPACWLSQCAILTIPTFRCGWWWCGAPAASPGIC